MTSGCSMKAMIRIGPAHRGHRSGSTSYTCLMSRAHARFAADAETSSAPVGDDLIPNHLAPAPHPILQDDHSDLFDLIRFSVRAPRLQIQDLIGAAWMRTRSLRVAPRVIRD